MLPLNLPCKSLEADKNLSSLCIDVVYLCAHFSDCVLELLLNNFTWILVKFLLKFDTCTVHTNVPVIQIGDITLPDDPNTSYAVIYWLIRKN